MLDPDVDPEDGVVMSAPSRRARALVQSTCQPCAAAGDQNTGVIAGSADCGKGLGLGQR